MGLGSKIRKELRRFDDRVRETGRDIDDQVRAAASDADDWRRENPILSAMIPFTPENQALMAGGGALLAGGSALGGLIGGGAAGAGGSTLGGLIGGGTAGLGSLGQLGLGLGQIGAGIYGAKQAGKAADAQIEAGNYAAQLAKESADKQLELQKQIWDKQQADQAPYLAQGQSAIGKLGSLMGGTDPFESYLQKTGLQGGLDAYLKQKVQYDDPFESYLQRAGLQGGLDAYLKQKGVSNYGFLNSPQYQFLQKQGQQALDRSAAARGMGYSGAQMKAAQQYGQGLASQQYDNEYNRAAKEYFNKYDQVANRFSNYYNRLDNEYNRAAKEYFNKYDQARGQFGDYYNRLAGIAQGGQQTAQSLGGMGSQYATNARNTLGELSNEQSNILGQQANARASAYATKANALNDTLGGLADLWSMRRKAV